ncbi:MAG: hypothetical protein GF346_10400, partial [Candidatus Eisenbacteria bacterium]|nr:hypothetical protein [Candidatus Latescibacterota bacterium]MBD3302846.1 hypothetical protein [Candidatus Eisenbacteria bacterium]
MKPSRILTLSLLALLLIPVALPAAVPSEVQLRSRTFSPATGLDALDRAAEAGAETRHFLVQLDRFADETERAELAALGVRLLDYIPQNTWIASFAPEALADPQVRARIVWAGEI